jgi:hypothetical protein
VNIPRRSPHILHYVHWFMNERPMDWARVIWDVDPSPLWLEGEL